ncbi:ABC transporter permease [Streptococcus dentiloxodontae]
MNWRHVWELSKVNLLYSNPSTLTQIVKKQEKKPKEQFSPIRSMFLQQLLMAGFFSLIYILMFGFIDFRQYPGIFSTYVATFAVMSIMQFFTALYSIFYESKDSQHYLPLPVSSREVYLAKILSSITTGVVFLMPILSLFGIAYWQILGGPLGFLPMILNFLVIFVTVVIFATAVTSLLGGLIIKSSRRKFYSTAIMVASYVFIMVPIFLMNAIGNGASDGSALDRPLLPYTRGFYDIVVAPFSVNAGLNFYLPLLVALGMAIWLYKVRMPRYFQEAFYSKKTRKTKTKAVNRNLRQTLIRHHLSTLGNPTLIINTFLFPLLYVATLGGLGGIVSKLDADFFGIALCTGALFGTFSAHPMSFLAVGASLEGNNFYFIESLPLNSRDYLRQKFWLFYSLQVGLPIIFYSLISLWFGFNFILAISFMVGFAAVVYLLGGYFFERDLRLFEPNWQEITQLFNRSSGNWIFFIAVFGAMILGTPVIICAVLLSAVFGSFVVSTAMAIILLIGGLLYYILADRKRWQRIGTKPC